MSLKGMLEDLPVLDMLQIIGFSTKTGYLRIDSPQGPGAAVFRDGKILVALSHSTREHFERLNLKLTGGDDEILQRYTETAIRELTQLREGRFEFELTTELHSELDGLDISPFLEGKGLNVQHLLLNLSQDIDEERRDAFDLDPLPASERDDDDDEEEDDDGDPSTIALRPAPNVRVLLVDDEPEIRSVVGDELQRHGYAVERAEGPVEALTKLEHLTTSQAPIVLLCDLKMPTSSGGSFLGGFELVERAKSRRAEMPIILLAESLPLEHRELAVQLGIQKVSFKPTLTKPDPELYRSDLHAFAREILRQLGLMFSPLARMPDGGAGGAARLADPHLDQIASLSAQLAESKQRGEIARLVLQAAAIWTDRGILFLVRNGQAIGMTAFGISTSLTESEAIARQLKFDVSRVEPFHTVVRNASPCGPTADVEALETPIFSRVGRGEAQEVILFPMLTHGEVIAILYLDNASTGKKLVKPQALETILARAGAALEKLFLRRKLNDLGSTMTTESMAR